MENKTVNFVSESQVVSYVVYVMAKLGYSRKNIAEVVQEMNNTFDVKSDEFIFKASLITGQEDRKHFLPTICRGGDGSMQGE
ncbi:hypothetical protein ACFO25_05090 [Paenactinomyces guangxiensis]|uniref:Uncharacterized protein n=1 Tax=Paenactinomyces guangxiensis TaxID=1490290 RepID=A0A7W1WPX5_9BACL|nr:hypothetical protein [Paenactinomyces guangxiensis]MBA4493753.1 hypothetical protein [Paenactinomyces guangxiensis]MBH8591041.1 hypothetical protein [Paenactinomyces guangxiensis]